MSSRPAHQSITGPRHECVSIDRKTFLAIIPSAVTIQSHWQGSSCTAKNKKTPPMIARSSYCNIMPTKRDGRDWLEKRDRQGQGSHVTQVSLFALVARLRHFATPAS